MAAHSSKGLSNPKEKWWKGLVGHPNDQGRHCKISFPFYFPHIFFLSFFILFWTAINLLMFVSMRKY
jgi:hypothetical protein